MDDRKGKTSKHYQFEIIISEMNPDIGMRLKIHWWIHHVLCILLAFFIPVFPRALPWTVGFIFLNWLFSGIFLRTISKLLSEKQRYLTLSLSTLYLLYLAGMLYTTDYSYGWFDLQVKLSLLILPLFIATGPAGNTGNQGHDRVLVAFVAGCIAGSFLFLSHSWGLYLKSGDRDDFYYTNLSWYFHPSYLSMYYNLGAAFLLLHMKDNMNRKGAARKFLLLAGFFYLEMMIFLLSSKAGLIVSVLLQILFIIMLISSSKGKYKPIIRLSVLFILVFMIFALLFPKMFGRIITADKMISEEQALKMNPEDGTVARKEIWKVSVSLILKHPLFGVGTGDVKDVLLQAYHDKGLDPIYRKKLNAHNQYLQTFLALGLAGFASLVLMLLLPAIRAFTRKNYLYFVFLAIFAINIFVESMLETQAGVIYFAFFNTLLFWRQENAETGTGTRSADPPRVVM